jgi:hypothetical protein
MMNVFLCGMIVLGMSAVSVFASIVASTGFENEMLGILYKDLGDATMDHDLINHEGESLVDSTLFSLNIGDWGYDASYVASSGSGGLTEGDVVGVVGDLSQVGSFTEGVQGYQFEDSDGVFVLTFDTIALPICEDVLLSLDLFVTPSTWELSDWVHVYAITDSGANTLLDTTGFDIDLDLFDGESLEGQWTTLTASISSCSVQLVVEFESNANTETMYIDNVVLATVPEPISMFLMGLGGLITVRFKNRYQA